LQLAPETRAGIQREFPALDSSASFPQVCHEHNQPTGGDCAARCKHIKSDNAKAGSVLLIHTNSRKHDAYAEKN